MTAKEIFNKLGYEQRKNDDEGIQYVKRAEDSKMQRIGVITNKYIEFYRLHKEINICIDYEYSDGETSSNNSSTLNIEEFKAVQKQVLELEW